MELKNFYKNKTGYIKTDNERCPICFENFTRGEEYNILNCIHVFHKHCLDLWLDNAQNCPMCRRIIK